MSDRNNKQRRRAAAAERNVSDWLQQHGFPHGTFTSAVTIDGLSTLRVVPSPDGAARLPTTCGSPPSADSPSNVTPFMLLNAGPQSGADALTLLWTISRRLLEFPTGPPGLVAAVAKDGSSADRCTHDVSWMAALARRGRRFIWVGGSAASRGPHKRRAREMAGTDGGDDDAADVYGTEALTSKGARVASLAAGRWCDKCVFRSVKGFATGPNCPFALIWLTPADGQPLNLSWHGSPTGGGPDNMDDDAEEDGSRTILWSLVSPSDAEVIAQRCLADRCGPMWWAHRLGAAGRGGPFLGGRIAVIPPSLLEGSTTGDPCGVTATMTGSPMGPLNAGAAPAGLVILDGFISPEEETQLLRVELFGYDCREKGVALPADATTDRRRVTFQSLSSGRRVAHFVQPFVYGDNACGGDRFGVATRTNDAAVFNHIDLLSWEADEHNDYYGDVADRMTTFEVVARRVAIAAGSYATGRPPIAADASLPVQHAATTPSSPGRDEATTTPSATASTWRHRPWWDTFDQITVNAYPPGEGIPPHIDNPHALGPVVGTLSLGDPVVMTFRRDATTSGGGNATSTVTRGSHSNGTPHCEKDRAEGVHREERCDVVLAPRSLVLMTGPSRYDWTHGIAAARHRDHTSPRFESVWQCPDGWFAHERRQWRVSVTYRSMWTDAFPNATASGVTDHVDPF